ncbi:uncharacterized protein ISCGN_010713 [Ixodes scapularis]
MPTPSQDSKWYQSIDGKPGFSAEALRALKLKTKANTTSGIATICSLMVDEMSIWRHLEWDGQKYVGYMDVGSGVDDNSLPLAKNAFVIMAVAINGRWKIPLGYFLADGLGGEQRANLVVQGLTHAHEAGALVVSLTCDGEPANFSMLRELGPKIAIVSFDAKDIRFCRSVTDQSCELYSYMFSLQHNTFA